MLENINILFVFVAGLASVLSPCVLPVVPIVVTGNSDDHRFRPLLIVGGISLSFILMGVLSSMFGSLIGTRMIYIEKAAGILIIIFGLLLLMNINLFKHLAFFSRFAQRSRGRLGGFLLGLTLGIIWIPCVGPMLSGVLAMVATKGELGSGVFLLFIYALGFAVPMLLAAYASQFFRKRFRGIGKYPVLINVVSGLLLVSLGIIIIIKGVIVIGM